MIVYIVNNRFNVVVLKWLEEQIEVLKVQFVLVEDDSDSDVDMQVVLVRNCKMKKQKQVFVVLNKKNLFDGFLFFFKFDWGFLLFVKKGKVFDKFVIVGDEIIVDDDEYVGGFEKVDDDKLKLFLFWFVDDMDIREFLKK